MYFHKSKSIYFPQFDDNFFSLFEISLDEGFIPDCEGIHCHDFLEFIYCRSNCDAVFQLDGHNYTLHRGDILLIPPQTPHSWVLRSNSMNPYLGYRIQADHPVSDFLLQFIYQHTDSQQRKQHFIRTNGTVWEAVGDLFRTLYEETHFRSLGWETSASAALLSLLTEVSRVVYYSPSMTITQEKSDFYQTILSYVLSNLGNKLTLEDIAQRFWVSPSTITNLFNKHAGTSFYKYVTTLRLTEAKNLMAEGMAMEKVALRVGFGDYSTFYRAFKKEFSISPRQFLQSIEK